MLLETPVPQLRGGTWGDVANYAIDLKAAVLECNADKQAIRNFVEAPEEP